MMGLTVVGKPAATPMTSSPFLIARSLNLGEVNVENATKFADEPEFTVMAYLTPINSANFFSNCSLKRPVVSQPSKEASTMFFNSSAPINFPDEGTIVCPGSNTFGENSIAAYSSTRAAICLRNFSCSNFLRSMVCAFISIRKHSC